MRVVLSAGSVLLVGSLVSCSTGAKTPGGTRTADGGIELERAGLVVHLKNPSQWVSVVDGKEVPVPPIPMGDDGAVRRIMEEGAFRSQVMENLNAIAVERGPRLTGSENLKHAQEWAMKSFREWGLTNVHLEEWGTLGVGFDRGPSSGTVFIARPMRPETRPGNPRRENNAASADGAAAANTSAGTSATANPTPATPAAPATTATPVPPPAETPAQPKFEWTKAREVELSALSWSIGTPGAVRGQVIREPKTDEEFAAAKESLKGSWVLLQAPPALGMRGIRSMMSARYEMRREARKKIAEGKQISELPVAERLAFEPIAGYISSSRDERVWTGAVSGWRDLNISERDSVDDDQPHVQVRLSDYDFINSRLADGEKVEVEFNVNHKFRAGPVPEHNVIADIKGSQYPDEIVIISGHLDSWDGPGSQGATDNGTGSSVTLEAARILMASNVRPLRTIRFVLWSGEEQGLLGSKGYVETHKDELGNISAVFVDDGGTGYEAGVQAAEVQVEMLAAATAPMNNVFYSQFDKKYLNVDIKNTGEGMKSHGGSDHASFNQVGVPGFFWEEGGRADYGYGWHTQNDTVKLAIEEYLVQSATNAAVVSYRLACAPSMLPRAKLEATERPNVFRNSGVSNNATTPVPEPTPATTPASNRN